MRKSVISLILTLTLMAGVPIQKVSAVQCLGDRYSVDRIISATGLESLGCFALSEYDSAVALFTQKTTVENIKNVTITYFGDNPSTTAVVETDYSKIVAADRAMAYSQNTHDLYTKSSTLYLYSNVALSSYKNYINEREQLFYYNTTRYNGSGNITPANLSALISVNGAKGYVKVSQIQIIPLIYSDNGWNYNVDISTGVKSMIPYQAYYVVSNDVRTTINGNQTFKQLKIVLNSMNWTYTNDLCLAPDWLPVGTYYSPDGIYFYYDVDLARPVYNGSTIGRFYNYYAYTNLRSKTNYTEADFNTYLLNQRNIAQNPSSSTMTNSGGYFINAQNKYGMNALLIYSMAALESGWGTSLFAQNPANLELGLVVKDINTFAVLPYTVKEFCANNPYGKYADENNVIHFCGGRYNLFGWGAYDSNPYNAQAFISIEACISRQMGINLRTSYMNYLDYRFYSSNIGNKGAGFNSQYASDPWWSLGIPAIAYQFDRYFGFEDLNSIQLGILDDTGVRTVYKEKELLNGFYTIHTRATNYPFIILEGIMVNGNLVYKVQTTNPVNDDGSLNTDPSDTLVLYDFNKSVGYIDADRISDYISKFVTGVVHQGIYNTDKQIYFTSGTATLDGVTILSGTNVSNEGVHNLIATSATGIVQNLQFTIDKTPPVITIGDYYTLPTNQNITISATVNDGILDVSSTTMTDNGTFTFKATDTAGNISEKSVTISNIDRVAPIITVDEFDGVTMSSSDITVSVQTNEGSLNESSHIFMRNGSFSFIATDLAGNITTQVVTVTNIAKPVVINYDSNLAGGTLSATKSSIPVVSGSTVLSTDQITFNISLAAKYHIYKWFFNADSTATRLTTFTLDYPYSDTSARVEFYYEADLNDDAKVTTTDLVQLRRSIAGLDKINEKAALAADINGDGKVSTTDLVKMRRLLAGLE